MGVAAGSFDEFYERNFPSVVRSLVAGVGVSVGAAEDAAQEAFVRALMRWRRVGGMEKPSGWVYVTAVRVALRTRPAHPPERATEHSEDQTEAVGERLAVLDAIGRLPERQRLAIVLRYFADLDLATIATAMGCALGTVKSTLHAAHRQLEISLDDDYAKEV